MEPQGHKDLMEPLDHKDLMEQQDHRALMEPQGHRAMMEPLERLDCLVLLKAQLRHSIPMYYGWILVLLV
jgi:hypothetical protein